MDPILDAVLNGTHRGDLTAEQEQALNDYLESPEGLAALASLEDDLGQAAAHLEPPELPESAWERVTQAIRDLPPVGAPAPAAAPAPNVVAFPQRPAEPPQWPKFLAMAAAVLLVVGVGLFLPLDLILGPQGSKALSSLDSETPGGTPPGVPEFVVPPEAGPGYVVRHYAVDELLVIHVAPKD
ncbi:MAG: hypothetical protein R3F62_08105 [Planctomycetota bacterium]